MCNVLLLEVRYRHFTFWGMLINPVKSHIRLIFSFAYSLASHNSAVVTNFFLKKCCISWVYKPFTKISEWWNKGIRVFDQAYSPRSKWLMLFGDDCLSYFYSLFSPCFLDFLKESMWPYFCHRNMWNLLKRLSISANKTWKQTYVEGFSICQIKN